MDHNSVVAVDRTPVEKGEDPKTRLVNRVIPVVEPFSNVHCTVETADAVEDHNSHTGFEVGLDSHCSLV